VETPRYRHYKNRAEPGDCIFATTTVLDFAPIFKSQRLANLAMAEIISYAIETQVRLHAFVLMHHHLHLVVRLNEQMSGSMWMQQLTSRTAHCIGKNLTGRQKIYLSERIGLNNRSFWKRSFRSVRIQTEKTFWQKVSYTHLNPVRAGYCECESDYKWSSKSSGMRVCGTMKEAWTWRRFSFHISPSSQRVASTTRSSLLRHKKFAAHQS